MVVFCNVRGRLLDVREFWEGRVDGKLRVGLRWMRTR